MEHCEILNKLINSNYVVQKSTIGKNRYYIYNRIGTRRLGSIAYKPAHAGLVVWVLTQIKTKKYIPNIYNISYDDPNYQTKINQILTHAAQSTK